MSSALNTAQLPFPPFGIWTSKRAMVGAMGELVRVVCGNGPRHQRLVDMLRQYMATGEVDVNGCNELIDEYSGLPSAGFWPYVAAKRLVQALRVEGDLAFVRIRFEDVYGGASRFQETLGTCRYWFIRERAEAAIDRGVAFACPVGDVIDAAYAAASTDDWATALSILKTPTDSVTYAEVMRWLERRRAGGYL